jgi:hypothetical protein
MPFVAHRRHLVLSTNLGGSDPLPGAPRLLVTPRDAKEFVSITVNLSPLPDSSLGTANSLPLMFAVEAHRAEL